MDKRPLGDRRRRVRLEVVGALWGTVELMEAAPIVDLSERGALILSPVAAAPDTIRPLTLHVAGVATTVDACVRHARPVGDVGLDGPRYLLGVEFVGRPAGLTHDFEPLSPHAVRTSSET